LRKDAVDYYDTVLCVGDHHIREIRASEKMYGLKFKQLVKYGYTRLDTLIEEHQRRRQKEPELIDGKKRILIAPSFGEHSILEAMGCELIDLLLRANYHVTARPHPVTQRHHPQSIQKIRDAFKEHPQFVLETEIRSHDSLHQSHCMISDWSGVSLEYAFALERPVIFIDVPRKIKNPDWEELSLELIEIKIRREIGEVVSAHRLNDLPQVIESLCAKAGQHKEQIRAARERTVFNIGKTGKVGADHIIRIASECKKNKEEGLREAAVSS